MSSNFTGALIAYQNVQHSHSILMDTTYLPFFPGFLVPASSYQYSRMSTRNLPWNIRTLTNRLLEICNIKTYENTGIYISTIGLLLH